MLAKEHRLTRSRDFRVVFTRGKTYTHRLIVLKVLLTGGQPSRFAFSASAKIGNAVIRNRSKRVLREAVRLLGDRVKQHGYDVVLIARPPLREVDFGDVRRAVDELFRKAGLLSTSEQTGIK